MRPLKDTSANVRFTSCVSASFSVTSSDGAPSGTKCQCQLALLTLFSQLILWIFDLFHEKLRYFLDPFYHKTLVL